MRRQTRTHPLQSFGFWCLILTVVAAGAAWKLDLLPQRDQAPQLSEFHSPDNGPGSAAESPLNGGIDGQSEPTIDGDVIGAVDILPEIHPAVPNPAAANAGTTVSSSPTPSPRAMPAVSRIDENPFGPRELEFVAAPDPAETILQASAAEPDVEDPGNAIERAEAVSEDTRLAAIDKLLAENTAESDKIAHRGLSEIYWQTPERRPEIMGRLEQTARRIYFLPQPHYMDPYVVQEGDRLESIAKRYDVSWQYLARLNRIEPEQIRPGQKLKVIKGPFTALVDLSDYELTVHCYGYFVYHFPIGIGEDGSTPTGTFRVNEKLSDPTYYGPDGVIANDDPQNPLGERWISIGNSYGIHGTIDPDSIGKSDSRGCIRMRNSDVEIVYDLLTVGSEVVIQP